MKPTTEMAERAADAIRKHLHPTTVRGLHQPGGLGCLAHAIVSEAIDGYELSAFTLDENEREVLTRWATSGEAKLADYQHLAKALDRAARTLVQTPTLEPLTDAERFEAEDCRSMRGYGLPVSDNKLDALLTIIEKRLAPRKQRTPADIETEILNLCSHYAGSEIKKRIAELRALAEGQVSP